MDKDTCKKIRASAKCWICEQPAGTREHFIKKPTVDEFEPHISQQNPLYLNTNNLKNKPIGSSKSNNLKFKKSLCASCNNEKTQPYDLAWDILRQYIIKQECITNNIIIKGKIVFGKDHLKQMLNVHLYFVKLFGCIIVDNNIPIDLIGFSNAIQQNKPHPNLYMAFQVCNDISYIKDKTGYTDLYESTFLKRDKGSKFTHFIWFYVSKNRKIAVHVVYSKHDWKLKGYWNPRYGNSKISNSYFIERW